MISIVICSHDRSDDVALCLSGLAAQLPASADELLIVDSCSAPRHAEALRSLASAYRANLIRLDTLGLSLARNAALAEARGAWVAYLDDDVVPFPDWLASLHKVVASGDEDLAVVGGWTEPSWPETPAPSHVSPLWLFFLSCIQDKVRHSVRQGAKVCGANLAFRRDSLLAIGGFCTELGRIGDTLIGGEETLVVKELLKRGREALYDPSVRVRHRISRERLTLAWIRKRAYWEGVTEAAKVTAAREPFPRNLFIPKLALSVVLFATLYALKRNPDFLIRSQIAAGALAARFKSMTPLKSAPIQSRA